MIHSILSKTVGLTILFSVTLLSGFWLHNTNQTAHSPAQETTTPLGEESVTSSLNLQKALNVDDAVETAPIQLASLSFESDYISKPYGDDTARPITDTDNRIRNAEALAHDEKFEDALFALENIQDTDKQNYTVKFLRARILSWSGKHFEAEQTFADLRRDYPQDPDVAVSYAYLHLYQNNYKQAEKLFTKVIKKHPDYQDAHLGLQRAKEAKAN